MKNIEKLIDEEEEIEIFDYLRVVIKGRWLIIIGTSLLVLFTSIFTILLENESEYEAKTTILVEEKMDYLKTGINESIDKKTTIDIYIEILKTKKIREKIAEKKYTYKKNNKFYTANLADFFGVKSIETAANKIKGKIKATMKSKNFMEIAVTMTDQDIAVGIANECLNQLNIYNQEQRNSNAKMNLEFIETRLEQIEDELGETREELVTFLESNRQLLFVNPTQKSGGVKSFPVLEVKREKLEQDVQLKSNLYNTLSHQYELAKIEAQKYIPVITLLEYADDNIISIPSKLLRNILVAVFVGLFSFSTLSFVIEYCKNIRQDNKEFLINELKKDKQLFLKILR